VADLVLFKFRDLANAKQGSATNIMKHGDRNHQHWGRRYVLLLEVVDTQNPLDEVKHLEWEKSRHPVTQPII
jgi:hypothetical protein